MKKIQVENPNEYCIVRYESGVGYDNIGVIQCSDPVDVSLEYIRKGFILIRKCDIRPCISDNGYVESYECWIQEQVVETAVFHLFSITNLAAHMLL